ncbi:hypothetical protein PHMEG_00031707 [Phytophthora megakarya]|uniref:Uncharacterized protein n=1 Tax=Phytophthora megakarya TaxID=4795 RepID=A0A225UXN0_9STRA|nr:hypothetical protein PHMEG_00031707 [Phytophthora megakarya]
MHRILLQVPASIAAYNKFMNAVDRVDQLRKKYDYNDIINVGIRYLHHQHICVEEAFGNGWDNPDVASVQIENSAIAGRKRTAERVKNHLKTKRPPPSTAVSVITTNMDTHVLTQNLNKARLTCQICSMRGAEPRSVQDVLAARKSSMSIDLPCFIINTDYTQKNRLCNLQSVQY